jgi:hypothetical protein
MGEGSILEILDEIGGFEIFTGSASALEYDSLLIEVEAVDF